MNIFDLAFGSLLQLICTIFYIGFIIYFMIKEIQMFYKLKLKYFQEFWSLIELVIIGCSWGSAGAYIWRFQEANRISKLFKETNKYTYINLQLTAYVNDVLTYLLGFCCFFGIIKFIKLISFNKRFTLFIQTLSYAKKELVSFLMIFSIIFMSFLSLFYLLFLSNVLTCSNVLSTAEMLFEMSSVKYNISDLIEPNPFLGPFCFALFIIIVVFIYVKILISIIISNFRRARMDQMDDQDILSFMLKKFLRWTGKNV